MKKLYSAVLVLAGFLALLVPAQAAALPEETHSAIATNNTIVVSNSADAPDAHIVHPAVYKIEGANYFKLRDLAILLNGSSRQFAVDYDDVSKSVSITSGAPYQAIGGELSGTAAERSSARISNNTVTIDGVPATLTVYKIDGANYFKLRDLGKALDFHVGYDDETKTVYISGANGYQEEAQLHIGDFAPASFSARYIRTNGYHAGFSYPVVTLVGSVDELRSYYEENRTLYDLSPKGNGAPGTAVGFADAIEGYDDAWFETHQLLIVLLEEGSGSVRHQVTNVTAGPEPVVDIDRLVPLVGTADMAQWHILIETDRLFDAADEIALRFTVISQ